MAHPQHTPTLASLEDAITVLFCLVDDTYTLLNPGWRSYESLKRLSEEHYEANKGNNNGRDNGDEQRTPHRPRDHRRFHVHDPPTAPLHLSNAHDSGGVKALDECCVVWE